MSPDEVRALRWITRQYGETIRIPKRRGMAVHALVDLGFVEILHTHPKLSWLHVARVTDAGRAAAMLLE